MVDHLDALTEVKTTVVLDEKVWRAFREYVLSRYGSARKMSKGVEEAIRSFTAANLLSDLSRQLGLQAKLYPSSSEIKHRRPKVKLSAGKVVREMRQGRAKCISRLK